MPLAEILLVEPGAKQRVDLVELGLWRFFGDSLAQGFRFANGITAEFADDGLADFAVNDLDRVDDASWIRLFAADGVEFPGHVRLHFR